MKTRHAAPVFQVADLEASLQHYTEVLGFSYDFRFGDYAGVQLGDVCLHLCGHTIHQRPVGGGTVYIFCAEPVDAYYAELTSRGATLIAPPKDYAYGMRDFIVADLDGNHLAFGCRSEEATSVPKSISNLDHTGLYPESGNVIDPTTVSLRPIQTGDEAAIQLYASDAEIARTCNVPHPYPANGGVAFVEKAVSARAARARFAFAILRQGEFVGVTDLNAPDFAAGTCKIDYWVARPHWNQGVATTAIRCAVSTAFTELGLRHISSACLGSNPASAQALEKNGFREIAPITNDGRYGQKFIGETIRRFTLDQADWAQKRT
jgi:RimJ/RimL family protein N-acetyltransferase/uncharacterized glyoxalase superfamily protein PhnB